MSFSPLEIKSQTLFTIFTTKLKEYQVVLKKAKGLIKSFVAYKHQLALKKKTAKRMWEALKVKFQHISLINILCLILNTTKIQLSDCIDIHKYCKKYQKTFDVVCSFIGEKCKLTTKRAWMFLNAGFFTGMGDYYLSFISIIKTK